MSLERGFYHPQRGYWQAIDVDPAAFDALMETYPEGTIEVPVKPGADYELQDGEWVYVEPVEEVPDRVSARQFKLQMLEPIEPAYPDGIIDMVEGWIATQPRAIRIAYENSGSFVRDDPMMAVGFAALGFTEEQKDEFFRKAALQ